MINCYNSTFFGEEPNTNRTEKQPISPNNTVFQESNKTPTERQPNEALNNYNKNNAGFLFNQFLVKLTNLSDGSYSYIKITETQSVINLIKEKEIKKVS